MKEKVDKILIEAKLKKAELEIRLLKNEIARLNMELNRLRMR